MNGSNKEAAPLLDQACAGGNAYSCSLLAELYYYGNGVETDTARGIALDTRACNLGDGHYCDGLGNRYGSAVGGSGEHVSGGGISQQGSGDLHQRQLRRRPLPRIASIWAFCTMWAMPAVSQGFQLRAEALFTRACDAGYAEGCSASIGQVCASKWRPEKDIDKARQFMLRVCALDRNTECDAAKKLH